MSVPVPSQISQTMLFALQALIAAAKGLRGMAALEQHLQQALQVLLALLQQAPGHVSPVTCSTAISIPEYTCDRKGKRRNKEGRTAR